MDKEKNENVLMCVVNGDSDKKILKVAESEKWN